MIRRTEGIVLRTQKFRETSLISHIYTRDYGRKSFIVRGGRSLKARRKHSYFQPMSILDLVFYQKEGRDLQHITENSSQYFYHRMQTEPVRIALGMLLIEVFSQAVKEEEGNPPLYDFLKETLMRLDLREDRLINVMVHFLVHLSAHLGFLPRVEAEGDGACTFDLNEGIIRSGLGSRPSDRLIPHFITADAANCTEIRFSNAEKRELLGTLLRYYRFHLEGFREPESLRVFGEVFRD